MCDGEIYCQCNNCPCSLWTRVSQVIANPHSIPGKHVTKWVKITTRTSQSSSICSQTGLWGQWLCNNCCFQGVFPKNSNKSNALLHLNMLVLWIWVNLRSLNPSLHPIRWATFVYFCTVGLPQKIERGQAISVIKKGLPVGARGRINKLKPVVFMEEACLWAEVRGKPWWEVTIYNLEALRRDDSTAVKVWQCLKTSEACHSYCVQIFVCLCGQDSLRAAKSSVPSLFPNKHWHIRSYCNIRMQKTA